MLGNVFTHEEEDDDGDDDVKETMQDRDLDLKWSAGGNLSITNLRQRYHSTCHPA